MAVLGGRWERQTRGAAVKNSQFGGGAACVSRGKAREITASGMWFRVGGETSAKLREVVAPHRFAWQGQRLRRSRRGDWYSWPCGCLHAKRCGVWYKIVAREGNLQICGYEQARRRTQWNDDAASAWDDEVTHVTKRQAGSCGVFQREMSSL